MGLDVDGTGLPPVLSTGETRPSAPDFEPPRALETKLFEIGFQNAPIGFALVDPSGHWLNVNDALCRILGYSREELLVGSFQDITHPDDLERDLAMIRDVLADRCTGYRLEKRYFHKDGRIIWIQLTTTLARGPDGSPRCFVSHVEDITCAMHDREKLQKLSERLQLATETAGLGVIDYDIAQGTATWDEHMFALYGLPANKRGAIDFDRWIACIHPDDLEGLLEALRETIRGGRPLETTYRVRLPTGGEKKLLVNARIVKDAHGASVRCIAVTRDVTEQHRASEELRAARDAAEAANRAKSAFLAMMSHEIRTPLHGIIGHTHLLEATTPVSREQSDHLSTIVSSGEALLAIIEDILDYSKIEAGKLQLEMAPFSLREIAGSSVAVLEPRAAAKHIVLKMQIAPEVPGMVLGDHARLRQVLTNLLANAVKFTLEGEVRLEVGSEPSSAGIRRVHFRISDTGIGIAPERIADLFQPFSQLDASITRRFGGTGLGLVICQRLVTSMGGSISLDSRENSGTTIDVFVPLQLAPPESAPLRASGATRHEPPRENGARGIPRFAPAVAALRILVAEDNAVNRQLIQILLHKCGSTHVEVVDDGVDAVSRLASGGIDVVLMDCQMPRLDGYKATREIRRWEAEDAARPRAAIIALTAGAFAEHRQRALDSGMDDFLTKPLRPEALGEALARCVPLAKPAG